MKKAEGCKSGKFRTGLKRNHTVLFVLLFLSGDDVERQILVFSGLCEARVETRPSFEHLGRTSGRYAALPQSSRLCWSSTREPARLYRSPDFFAFSQLNKRERGCSYTCRFSYCHGNVSSCFCCCSSLRLEDPASSGFS